MDKGIRPYCRAKFVELNEQRRRNLMTNTQFRKTVMADVMEQFGVSVASAATHYNDAFKNIKELNAELVSGLGRPEDKKGGRKPKAKPAAVEPETGSTLSDVLLSNVLSARAGNEGEGEVETPAPPVARGGDAVQEPEPEPVLALAAPTAPTVRVCKVADGTVVADGLTQEAAEQLIAKAAAAKKSKLQIA